MILHLSHIFFTEARTFIFQLPNTPLRRLLIAISYASSIEVVWRQFNQHTIARKDTNKMLAHLTGYVRKHLVLAIFQLNAKHRVRQGLEHFRHYLYSFFLSQNLAGEILHADKL